MKTRTFAFLVIAATGLSACSESFEGTTRSAGPNSYIAVAADFGRDSTSNQNDSAAIAITPDGCQAWLIDDGVEGRASNRLDPVSGLPVCSAAATPGVVYGPYQSSTQGIGDRVPRQLPEIELQQVEARPTTGHAHHVRHR
jgi:hypothetical protein